MNDGVIKFYNLIAFPTTVVSVNKLVKQKKYESESSIFIYFIYRLSYGFSISNFWSVDFEVVRKHDHYSHSKYTRYYWGTEI